MTVLIATTVMMAKMVTIAIISFLLLDKLEKVWRYEKIFY